MAQEMTIIAKPDLRDPNVRRSKPPGGTRSRPAAPAESSAASPSSAPTVGRSPSSPAAAEPRPSPTPQPESHTRTTRSRTPTHPSSRGARRSESPHGEETTVRRPGRRSTLLGFSLGLLVDAAALVAVVTRKPPQLFAALDRWIGRAAAEPAPAVDPASDSVSIAMEIVPRNARVSMDGIPIRHTIDLPKSSKERMLLIEAGGYRSTNMLVTAERSRNVHIQLTRNDP